MKKIIIILGIILCFSLTGCTLETKELRNYDASSHLIAIEGEKDLYYYSTTRVIYIVFNEGVDHRGYGYMSPYYSENGKLCIYDAQRKEIVELKDR